MVTGHLHTLLLGMIEDAVDQRVTLDYILSSCEQHVGEGSSAQEEVDRLVTYVLGPSQDVTQVPPPCP